MGWVEVLQLLNFLRFMVLFFLFSAVVIVVVIATVETFNLEVTISILFVDFSWSTSSSVPITIVSFSLCPTS